MNYSDVLMDVVMQKYAYLDKYAKPKSFAQKVRGRARVATRKATKPIKRGINKVKSGVKGRYNAAKDNAAMLKQDLGILRYNSEAPDGVLAYGVESPRYVAAVRTLAGIIRGADRSTAFVKKHPYAVGGAGLAGLGAAGGLGYYFMDEEDPAAIDPAAIDPAMQYE